MVPGDQFLQCDVRLRQATQRPHDPFGKLALNVCGDFLQLPPVDKDGTRKSLALPLDAAGCFEDAEDRDDEDAPRKKQGQIEARQGFELWRTITKVVCLTVNIRAPGVLGRLQAEMRAGHISDEMWAAYQSRIMSPNDARLRGPDSPFAQHDVHCIVHRHKIRVLRSFENARSETRSRGLPLYVVQARDEVVHGEDAAAFSSEVRAEVLRRVNPDQTKGLPSFLPLYPGMRLVLGSKDCVRFGLVKGCVCMLEDIVFADDEMLPTPMVAGDPHSLRQRWARAGW